MGVCGMVSADPYRFRRQPADQSPGFLEIAKPELLSEIGCGEAHPVSAADSGKLGQCWSSSSARSRATARPPFPISSSACARRTRDLKPSPRPVRTDRGQCPLDGVRPRANALVHFTWCGPDPPTGQTRPRAASLRVPKPASNHPCARSSNACAFAPRPTRSMHAPTAAPPAPRAEPRRRPAPVPPVPAPRIGMSASRRASGSARSTWSSTKPLTAASSRWRGLLASTAARARCVAEGADHGRKRQGQEHDGGVAALSARCRRTKRVARGGQCELAHAPAPGARQARTGCVGAAAGGVLA